jgi:hypothetical protein
MSDTLKTPAKMTPQRWATVTLAHARERNKKRGLWTHASVFVVWENVRDDEVTELEGLFRQIYQYDSRVNALNKQRRFRKLREVQDDDIESW